MVPFPLRSHGPLAAGSLGLLLALLVCAPPVHGQQKSSGEPSTQDSAREILKELKGVQDHDPTSKQAAQYFVTWVVCVVLAVVVGVVVVAFKVGIWLLSRMATTTDQQKLLMSDPWIRAQLAKQQAQGIVPPSQAP